MARSSYPWREVYLAALEESDPKKLLGCIERATTAMERRYADWGYKPGTADELRAIRVAISVLEGRLKEKLSTRGRVKVSKPVTISSSPGKRRRRSEFDVEAKRLLLLLRSFPLHGKRI